jgi:hypothetical protein
MVEINVPDGKSLFYVLIDDNVKQEVIDCFSDLVPDKKDEDGKSILSKVKRAKKGLVVLMQKRLSRHRKRVAIQSAQNSIAGISEE